MKAVGDGKTEWPEEHQAAGRHIMSRLALNEAIERDLNALHAHWNDDSERSQGFWCECSRPDCNRMIEVFKHEWEAVRGSSHRFFVAVGHDEPWIATVIDKTDRFWVVLKNDPTAKRIAEEKDPESNPIIGTAAKRSG